MVNRITAEAYSTGTGVTGPYNHVLSQQPVRRGSVTITAGSQSAVDDGLGGFVTTPAGGSGSINYTTGSASITFLNVVPNPTPITVTYDQHQGFPVMGVMTYFTQQNIKEMIVADTTYVNRYNAATNRLDDISPATLLTGNKFNFMSWVNYPDPLGNQRLLFVNFNDPVQQYDGTTVKPYPIYTDLGTPVTGGAFATGDGSTGPYAFSTPAGTGIAPGIFPGFTSATITEANTSQTITIDQFGVVSGDGTGTVDLLNGTITVTFLVAIANGDPILISYTPMINPIDTALHISNFQDHLFVEYTIEGTKEYGRRIRTSGTGAYCDTFVPNYVVGAGVVDISSDTYLSSSDFNRNDRVLFTNTESWSAKYSQNDAVPFTYSRLDSTRGSQAPYGTITYLNRTNAVSTLGFIITDGYSVDRSDYKLPDYSFNSIDPENFKLCFAGSVDVDRDHYLIHPSMGNQTSNRILVTNYEEDNFSIYRIPLSCMGSFVVSKNVTWDDLLVYNTWDEMAKKYGSWNAFAFSKGAPLPVGGGHQGQIVQLNDTESEDYPVNIRNITIIDDLTVQVTTDFQDYQFGDYVCLEAVNGMFEINDKQGQINQVISPYIFNLKMDISTANFSPYTGGGQASKCIVFSSTTKKFNPFANADRKVSCGWMYFYVSTSGTDLTKNEYIYGATKSDPCILEIPGHGYQPNQQIYINSVGGMTELNGLYFNVGEVIDQNHISLLGVDSIGYTTYTSGGFSSTPVNANLQVRVITNDTEEPTQVNPYNPTPYLVNLTNQSNEIGIKKWYKIWINQTARFLQFEISNNQSGAQVQIHAIMPGFAAVGRMV